MKTTLRLNIPRQRFETLSFCGATPEAMHEWVANLPVTNVIATAMRLYEGIMELNQLQCHPEHRFLMLEELRGAIHSQCRSLSLTFLRGPLVLSGHAQQLADLVQALQNQLAMGYKVVVADGVQARIRFGLDPRPHPHTMASALHRAISDLTRSILCSCQLYTHPPSEIWLELHQLYRFAEIKEMLEEEVADPENELMELTTIGNAYLRAALLGCVEANTMRRDDLTHLFHALEIWASHACFGPVDDEALFLVDLSADAPPVYGALNEAKRHDACRSLDTRALVDSLNHHLGEVDTPIPVPDSISPEVVRHAVHSWGGLARRIFTRAPANGELHVCVGISATHYHIAGEMDFADLLGEDAADALNPFLRYADEHPLTREDRDIWDKAFDASRTRMSRNPNVEDNERQPPSANDTELDPSNAHPSFATEMVDASPGGYCIRWRDEVPANLQTGELLAVREETDAEWAVAVVRWVRNVKNEGTLMGIELLAPRALAVGARVIRKKGGATDYLRALLLPELRAIRQPARVITPKLPFQSRQKIQINQAGQVLTAQLGESTGSTEGFSQFEFRLLEGAPQALEEDAQNYRGLSIYGR
ncbi:MAG: hypothetical protein O7G84_11985 [Gammaproteobacteria bacterium]|nr:hypothetical protein [Gammaproteobacteria bacterium]